MNELEYVVMGSSYDKEEWFEIFCADETTALEKAEKLLIFYDYDEIQIWQGWQIVYTHEEVMQKLGIGTQTFVMDFGKLISALY